MLTCYGHQIRLPQSDLTYVAFRLTLFEALSEMELQFDLEDEPDSPVGYLTEVPFLEQVPLPVQVDLLADVWKKHQSAQLFEATLLDAAIIYGCCETAKWILHDMPEVAVAWLRPGPRKITPRIVRRAEHRLEEMFDAFWDDRDFLLLHELQDLPPEKARRIRALLHIPEEWLDPLYEALQRWRVSADVDRKLAGLMTEEEIASTIPLLTDGAGRSYSEQGLEDGSAIGLEDLYHGLLVGPCDEATADAEAECCLVVAICVPQGSDFECSYAEWLKQFKTAVQEAVELPLELPDFNEMDVEEQLRLAQTSGLEDGSFIEARGDGWVVVDRHGFFLSKPCEAAWIADEDDECVPVMMFETAELALAGWYLSCQIAAARMQRHEEAIRLLEGFSN